jgi:serine/threonine-protein kinase
LAHGQTLGRYTLVEQLALGGMAEIWLAHLAGPEGFEKAVVIKKIRPHLAKQKNFLKMFLNEARLAAQLNHPNIVQIYEFGNPKEQHYIAMEYIFGRDLSEIVPKARAADIPFPTEYAIKIIAQVCEGLYYAHTKTDKQGQPLKIIHRDISPQNVLVSFDGHVKILDFGIAKAANQYEQTQQGILKGKVSYMAPEQILGHPFDNRVDIFSLGAVFYELITGYKLFSGDNEISILRSITEGAIYPPSYFNEDVPTELEDIIMKALAKEPDERYQNAWEMQRDLNQLLSQFDFHPTNTHLANFLKQLFEDEIEQEARYLEQKLQEIVEQKRRETTEEPPTPAHTTEQKAVTTEDEATQEKEEHTGTKRLYDTRPDLDLDALSESDALSSPHEQLPMIVPDDEASPTTPPPRSHLQPIAAQTQTSLASPHVTTAATTEHPTLQGFDHVPSHSPDESMSQILFTLRFRTKQYDALHQLAAYHELSLEELIHAMIECSKPFFEAEFDSEPES